MAGAGSESQELAELYRRFGPALHRRALQLTNDSQAALDVTQESFLAYMQQRGKLRGDAQPFTVLYQIATFKAVDVLRGRSKWSGAVGTLDVDDGEGEGEAAQLESASHEGGMRRVEAAQDLALLTRGEEPDVLTAAFLYFVESHTTEEIAQVMDLSRKTVGKMLQRFSERARKRSARLEEAA